MKTFWMMLTLNLILVHQTALALELDFKSGYNDNPFKQASTRSGSGYAGLHITHKGRTQGSSHLQYTVDIYGERHELADANSVDAKARLRWVQSGRLFGNSASLLITGDLMAKRSTFVDQLTGQVAKISSGERIGDRFSNDSLKLGIEGIYRFDQSKSVALYVFNGERQYVEDYESLGLESLNFSERGIQPSFRYKSGDGHYMKVFAYLKQRTYDGLLNDDLAGMNVEGSTVDYTLTGAGLLVSRQLSEFSSLRFYLQAYQARDDYQGARDMDYWKLESRYQYDFSNGGQLNATLTGENRAYQNDVVSRLDSEISVPGKERALLNLKLSYEQPIEFYSRNLTWLCSIQTEIVNNSDQQRSYQQNTFLVGLRFAW